MNDSCKISAEQKKKIEVIAKDVFPSLMKVSVDLYHDNEIVSVKVSPQPDTIWQTKLRKAMKKQAGLKYYGMNKYDNYSRPTEFDFVKKNYGSKDC